MSDKGTANTSSMGIPQFTNVARIGRNHRAITQGQLRISEDSQKELRLLGKPELDAVAENIATIPDEPHIELYHPKTNPQGQHYLRPTFQLRNITEIDTLAQTFDCELRLSVTWFDNWTSHTKKLFDKGVINDDTGLTLSSRDFKILCDTLDLSNDSNLKTAEQVLDRAEKFSSERPANSELMFDPMIEIMKILKHHVNAHVLHNGSIVSVFNDKDEEWYKIYPSREVPRASKDHPVRRGDPGWAAGDCCIVVYVRTIQAKFKSNFYFARYPFDTQQLKIKIKTNRGRLHARFEDLMREGKHKFVSEVDPKTFYMDDEWRHSKDVHVLKQGWTNPRYSASGNQYHTLSVGVTVRRRYGHNVDSMVAPHFVIVCLSHTSILCEPDGQQAERLMITLTMVLAAVARHRDDHPDISASSSTLIDKYINFCLLWMVGVAIENIVGDLANLSVKTEQLLFALFFISWIFLHVAALFWGLWTLRSIDKKIDVEDHRFDLNKKLRLHDESSNTS